MIAHTIHRGSPLLCHAHAWQADWLNLNKERKKRHEYSSLSIYLDWSELSIYFWNNSFPFYRTSLCLSLSLHLFLRLNNIYEAELKLNFPLCLLWSKVAHCAVEYWNIESPGRCETIKYRVRQPTNYGNVAQILFELDNSRSLQCTHTHTHIYSHCCRMRVLMESFSSIWLDLQLNSLRAVRVGNFDIWLEYSVRDIANDNQREYSHWRQPRFALNCINIAPRARTSAN